MAEVVAQWQRLAAAAIPLMLVSGAALIVLCISAVPAQLRRILAVFLSLIAIGSAAFAGWCFTAAFLGADMSAAVQTGRVRVYERALEAEGLLASARNEFAAFDEKYRAMRQLRPVPITDVATLSTPDKRDRADALIAALTHPRMR